MQSLRDKLLKAGLVSEEAAKKSEAEKAAAPARRDAPRRDDRGERATGAAHHERPRPNGGPRHERGPRPEVAVRIPKLPPMAGSKEANRLMSKRQLELDRKIRELVLANQVAVEVGATTFYFVTRKNTLRRLELTAEQAKALEQGALAVVERPDPDKIEHALVPPAIAEQIHALSARAVRFLNKPGAQIGFLSEAEIGARSAEATGAELAEANEPDDDATEAPPAEVAASADTATFITIKRAPKS